MILGLPCDRDGYDLRAPQCKHCGSRGCPNRDQCKNDIPAFRAQYLCEQANRLDAEAVEHNHTPMRQKLFDLLTNNGYRRKWPEIGHVDDWYVRIDREAQT